MSLGDGEQRSGQENFLSGEESRLPVAGVEAIPGVSSKRPSCPKLTPLVLALKFRNFLNINGLNLTGPWSPAAKPIAYRYSIFFCCIVAYHVIRVVGMDGPATTWRAGSGTMAERLEFRPAGPRAGGRPTRISGARLATNIANGRAPPPCRTLGYSPQAESEPR